MKLTLVPGALGLAGVTDERLTDVTGVRVPTVTGTATDVAEVPLLKNACAVRVCAPAAAVVHEKLYGAALLTPMGVVPPSAKNSIRMIVVPVGAVAVAVIGIGAPTAKTVPLIGAVMATVAPTVTAIAGEVAVMALLKVAVAVRLKAPEVAGVQVKLNGDTVLVPIRTALA